MNNKGWLRIVEASIALVLIATVWIIMNQSQTPVKSDQEITSLENRILNEMVGDDLMRQKILDYNIETPVPGSLDELKSFVTQRVPVGVNSTIKVCNVNDICNLDEYTPQIYARERIVSSTLKTYGPRKVKLFIWLK